VESRECIPLHKLILQIVRKWTMKNYESFPTIKEKSTIAAKMACFEHFDPKNYEDYMELVADIYEDESLARTEITVRLENVFLAGTRLSKIETRNRFSRILDKSIPESIQARMKYILGVQNWQHLSNTFWITQCTHVLI